MGSILRVLCLLLLLLLPLAPLLLPPLLIQLSCTFSWVSAYTFHVVGPPLPPSWDYIVVGAGSAGSVVAGRLAAEGHRVLLVEAGGPAPSLSHIPGMVAFQQKSPLDWQFTTEASSLASLSTGGVSTWPRGKILGGSSMLNYMLYVRGNSRDYDEWRDLGLEGWGWEDVLPYFKKSEDFIGEVEDRVQNHGQGGDMKVTSEGYKEPVLEAFLEAGEELGYKVGDINGAVQDEGFGRSHTTTYRAERSGTYRAFAERYAGGNLTVLPYSQVTRVVVEQGRAVGVEVSRFGKLLRLLAEREVVLSAGAVGTPHILLLSGIGDTHHLKEVGVEPVLHLPGVGSNLQDHLFVGLNMDVAPGTAMDPLTMLMPTSWLSLLQGGGPLGSNVVPGMAHVRTLEQDPRDPRPDILFHMLSISMATDRGMVLKDKLGFQWWDPIDPWVSEHYDRHSASLSPMLSRPKSRGTIRLRSADPFVPPIIQPNYLSEQQDVDTLVAGLQFSLKLLNTSAFQSVGASAWPADPHCQHLALHSVPYWQCYVRHYALTVYHPVGTAAMGTVTDSRLRVVGLRGLRVADGSVMPRLVGGNTNAPIIMIGEKCAHMLLEDAKTVRI